MVWDCLFQSGGFIVYRTELTKSYPGSVLNVSGIRDRAHVFLDKVECFFSFFLGSEVIHLKSFPIRRNPFVTT